MPTTVNAIRNSLEKTDLWLKDLKEIGAFETEEQAYTALRAALHTIRDRLTVEEATHLGAQLPLVIRGFYYEGWRPALAPNKERTKDQFLESVVESLRTAQHKITPEVALASTFELLKKHIAPGQ